MDIYVYWSCAVEHTSNNNECIFFNWHRHKKKREITTVHCYRNPTQTHSLTSYFLRERERAKKKLLLFMLISFFPFSNNYNYYEAFIISICAYLSYGKFKYIHTEHNNTYNEWKWEKQQRKKKCISNTKREESLTWNNNSKNTQAKIKVINF